MANPFDRFDEAERNPFDAFDEAPRPQPVPYAALGSGARELPSFKNEAPANAFAKAAVGGLGAIAKGAEALSYQVPPQDEFGNPINAEWQAEYDRRMVQPAAQKLRDIQAGPLFEWGKAVQEAAAEVYPVSDAQTQGMLTQLGGMAGGFLPLVASGPAAPLTIGLQTIGDNLEEDFARQVEKGKSADEAAEHAINRSLASGAVQAALFEVLPKPLHQLGDAMIDKFGRAVFGKFLAGRVAQAGEGAALGAASHTADNLTMERPALEGAGESALGLAAMQALMPRGGPQQMPVRRPVELDTGKNVPESRATLEAQQEQLVRGLRPAQMFPAGTEELPLPKGMQRIESERGVFHFNPQLATADEILSASQRARENDVLNLGRQSKAEVEQRVAATGEQRVAVTERTPEGTEVRTAVATDQTAPLTLADFNRTKTPGNVVAVEPIGKVPAERRETRSNLVEELLNQQAADMQAQRENEAREGVQREQRQKELQEKRARFDERIAVARDVMARPEASFAEVQGALESVKFYAEDNSLGLAQEQRETAARAQAALAQRFERLKAEESVRRDLERLRREADEMAAEAQRREERRQAAAKFEQEKAAGIGASGEFDYKAAPMAALEQRAEKFDERAIDEIARRSATEGETRDELLNVLRQVKLPTSDAALGTELATLLREGMTPQQRLELTSAKRDSLDRTAEALRERGFAVDTPNDVLDVVSRALRGEKIYADRAEPQVDLATRAYHGTPHTVEKFSTDKIGSGEGHQAYGWGLYFAENPKVAEAYQQQVRDSAKIDGLNARLSELAKMMHADEVLGSYRQFRTEKGRAAAAEYDRLMAEKQAPGNLYAVELLPDAEDLLAWDLPFSEQSKQVRKALEAMRKLYRDTQGTKGPYIAEHTTGENIYRELRSQFVREFAAADKVSPFAVHPDTYKRRAEEAASRQLAKIGIPGIRYLDAGSRSANEKTANIVIFDENLVKILEKNGVAFATSPDRRAAISATTATGPQLSEADIDREITAIRKAFPQLVRENDVQLGNVQRALAQRGYRDEVPPEVQAAVARLNGQRTLIVLSARAYRDRAKGAGLLTHEMAHPFWDTLPAETQEDLRHLHEREVRTQTGPLYSDGVLKTDLDFVADMDERGHKEWFAERIARLNEQWAKGNLDRAEQSLLKRIAYQFREFIRKAWSAFARKEGVDPEGELFVEQFRRFFESGGDLSIAREAGAAWAKAMTPEFATGKPEDIAAHEKRYEQLREDFDRATADTEKIRAEMKPLWEIEGRDNEIRLRALNDALSEAERHAKNSYTQLTALRKQLDAAKPTRPKLPEGKTPEQVIAEAARVEALPKVDRKAALLAELQRGRALRDEGANNHNDATFAEGVRIAKLARERLDEEYPGWEREAANTARKQAGLLNAGMGKEPGATPAAEPVTADESDREHSPFAEPAKEMPVRTGKVLEVYGHTSHQPTVLARTWERAREVFRGIKGSVPELPTFGAAFWNKSDSFIREHGPNFYDGIKAFYRKLVSANDGVQRQAEDDVAKITKPLLAAGGRFEANDYARMTRLQEVVRRLNAEKKPVPARVTSELTALNSKLESHPYVLFERLVLMLDLNWRQQNLKDSAGNPIALPSGINEAEIKAELARLGTAIAASDHEPAIRAALDQHMALVKRVAADLQQRELMAVDALQNPFYFPHLTLEVTRGGKTEERELRPSRVKPGTEAEFRGYLVPPKGSTKPIETDYVRALYFHLVQVGAHNVKADAVRDYARPYDIKAQVEARAKALTKERGVSVSWEQAFHDEYAPRGYVLMGVEANPNPFVQITVDRERLARRLGVMLTSDDLQKQLHELGLRGVKLLSDDLRETLQQGVGETWIVPARVDEALRGIAERQTRSDAPIEAAMKASVSFWKAWKLFMPLNHVRYEYGNVVGDLEKLFSASPHTFKYLPESAEELRDFWAGGQPSDDLRAAVREGVINTITAQDMHALFRLRAFEEMQPRLEKLWDNLRRLGSAAVSRPLLEAAWFGNAAVQRMRGEKTTLTTKLGPMGSPEISAFREAVFRYAKFKGDLKALREGARPAYAGAYARDIDAMQESRPGAKDADVRKAAAISKATFGDYGDISVTGHWLREKLIPFYSWTEVNFKYHANLLRNLRDMVRAGEASQAEAMKAGTRAAAVFAAGFTARAAGAVMLRLALPYLAVYLWNNSGDRDELEKELSEEDRRTFHIILGRDAEGKVQLVKMNTAFVDVVKWFSGPKFAQAMAGWMGGKTDFVTAFSAWRDGIVPDFINNTVGQMGPLVKMPYTYASKKNPFPDVTDQRTVPAYDMRRVILGQATDEFTADLIERVVNKDYYASKDLGAWAKQLILQVRQRDPEQWAFYAMKDKAADFVAKQTGQKRDTSYDAPDQQVLRNFRRAIYRGDIDKAVQFRERLLDYGYTAERFAASVRAQDPLSELPKPLRRPFVESLTPPDRELLERAYAYYTRINASKGHEAQLFPRARSGERGLERYRATPRDGVLRQQMETVAGRDDDEELLRAEKALRASLQKRR